MEKEELINDFLKVFKITLHQVSIYPPNHPIFIRTLNDFKLKLELLFQLFNSVNINFTSSSLILNDKIFEKDKLYEEIAQFFHYRRIKNIEFRKGVSLEELISFFSKICLSIKDILKAGGLPNLLKTENLQCICIEELDYSYFLKKINIKEREICTYLLKKILDKNDEEEIVCFSETLQEEIRYTKIMDILGDEDFVQNIFSLFKFLKERGKHHKFLKTIVSLVLDEKEELQKESLKRLNILFSNFDIEDIAEELGKKLANTEEFNVLGFKLFLNLLDEDKHKRIAELFSKDSYKIIKNSLTFKKNIEKLLLLPKENSFPETYKKLLSLYLEKISFKESSIILDKSLVIKNYHSLLFNLLSEEKNEKKIKLILEKISQELEKLIDQKNLDYLYDFFITFNTFKNENIVSSILLEDIYLKISKFIQILISKGEDVIRFQIMVENLDKKFLDFNFYLEELLKRKDNFLIILKILFKFFPENLKIFYERLNRVIKNDKFVLGLIDNLKEIDNPITLEILKHIYFLTQNKFVKLGVLRAMENLSNFDKLFLFSILEKEPIFKKEALLILKKQSFLLEEALRLFLFFPNFLGFKNKLLKENLAIIEELEIEEAKKYLTVLSQKKFFWNREVRKLASKILLKYNERKS
ncbi:MAG: hypothetical protein QXZ20_02020 [Candidatus Aenigmatarchaeota archaeon]